MVSPCGANSIGHWLRGAPRKDGSTITLQNAITATEAVAKVAQCLLMRLGGSGTPHAEAKMRSN